MTAGQRTGARREPHDRGPGAAPAPAGATGAPALPAMPEGVRATTLPSGVRVVTEAMPSVRSAAVGFWVGTGSRHEDGEVGGATHFLEHLLFKGTRRRSAHEIAEALESVGGELNAFTSKELTCFHARCLDRDLPLAIDVIGDMMTSALVRAGDVDGERQVVLEEIRMHLDTPDDLVHSVFAEALFGEHPLGREVLGDAATISAMGRETIARWYREQYVPDNLVVAAAGNLDHDEVVARVAETLEGWSGSVPARTAPEAPVAPARTVLARARPTEQAHLVVGGLGVRRDDPRRFAARVLDEAVGGGMSSRLFQEIRERRGLAYAVFSYLTTYAEAGTWGVYAGTAPENLVTVRQVIDEELARVTDEGLDDAELARAQSGLTGALVLALEDTGSRMSRLGKAVVTGAPLLSIDETIAAVEAVTADDVREVAAATLGGPRTAAVVGPEGALTDQELERVA